MSQYVGDEQTDSGQVQDLVAESTLSETLQHGTSFLTLTDRLGLSEQSDFQTSVVDMGNIGCDLASCVKFGRKCLNCNVFVFFLSLFLDVAYEWAGALECGLLRVY